MQLNLLDHLLASLWCANVTHCATESAPFVPITPAMMLGGAGITTGSLRGSS